MKKPTKKELREMSDRDLLNDYEYWSSATDLYRDAAIALPVPHDSGAKQAHWKAAEIYQAYREEILRRMGGAT